MHFLVDSCSETDSAHSENGTVWKGATNDINVINPLKSALHGIRSSKCISKCTFSSVRGKKHGASSVYAQLELWNPQFV